MLLLPLLVALTATDYVSEIKEWRAKREARLKADDGWLTVAGLFWLRPGDNSIGTAASDRIVLPRGRAPERAGTIKYDGARVVFTAAAPEVRINGETRRESTLRSDADTGGKPDLVTIGPDLTLFVIKRGERLGIRLKDKQSEFRRGFRGLEWFPVAPEWRVTAKWVAYPQPKRVEFESLGGGKQVDTSPGYAVFTVAGKEYSLEPTQSGDELFFVFRDRTAGKLTYPAARFIYSAMPEKGQVVIDFNKAYNPPCAFTPFSTCPLPTPGNRLPIEIRAGEMKYKGANH